MSSARQDMWAVRDGVVSAPLDDEIALLNFSSKMYFTLNATGAYIWSRVQEPRSTEEIATAVSEEFNIDFNEAMADVQELLSALHESGLVRRAPTPPVTGSAGGT
ncbi:hypothetical protein LCGC14_2234020 [marine sediment metagenome]|uniref:PqqD family protein n=1 Tax=marine sediment metagenome TaxID=412755 RepID=A0A0F9D753_9ZZZZ